MPKPVTLWLRFDGTRFRLNHIEDGHAETLRPAPKHPSQIEAWSNVEWLREHASLSDEVPAKIVRDILAKLNTEFVHALKIDVPFGTPGLGEISG